MQRRNCGSESDQIGLDRFVGFAGASGIQFNGINYLSTLKLARVSLVCSRNFGGRLEAAGRSPPLSD